MKRILVSILAAAAMASCAGNGGADDKDGGLLNMKQTAVFIPAGFDTVAAAYVRDFTPIPDISAAYTSYSNYREIGYTYRFTVAADAVPENEEATAELPLPLENIYYDMGLDVQIADSSEMTRCARRPGRLILSRKAIAGKPLEFKFSVKFKGADHKGNLNADMIIPYRKDSSAFRDFISLNEFSAPEKLKEEAMRIIGGENNPYLKARAVFDSLGVSLRGDSTAGKSSRDAKCAADRFRALCRAAEVPAREVSGWLMYPDCSIPWTWTEVFYEGIGWTPADVTFGRTEIDGSEIAGMSVDFLRKNLYNNRPHNLIYFYLKGVDSYHVPVYLESASGKALSAEESADLTIGRACWKGGPIPSDRIFYSIETEDLGSVMNMKNVAIMPEK